MAENANPNAVVDSELLKKYVGVEGTNPLTAADNLAVQLLKNNQKNQLSQSRIATLPNDNSWITNTLSIPVDAFGNIATNASDISNFAFSTANIDYTDTSVGGALVFNPPPAFTCTADVPDKGIRPDTVDLTVNPMPGALFGKGHHYAEAISDPMQVVHVRCGQARYNSLLQFFTGFYNGDLASLSRQGRLSTSMIQSFFNVINTAVEIAILPLAILPNAFILLGDMARYFLNMPAGQFYTLKPNMPLYWETVSSIFNQLLSYEGLVNSVETTASNELTKRGGADDDIPAAKLSAYGKYFPKDIIKQNGTVEIYGLANRAKRMQIRHEAAFIKAVKSAGTSSDNNYYKLIRDTVKKSSKTNYDSTPRGLEAMLRYYINKAPNESLISSEDADKGSFEQDLRNAGYDSSTRKYTPQEQPTTFFEYLMAQLGDGGEFISFAPDYTGAISRSFSNSTSPSSLASSINSKSSSARETRINMADGNVTEFTGQIADGVKSVLGTLAGAFHIEGLATLAGSAFIQIPDNWSESIANAPSMSYTFTLTSPYAGNPVARAFQILYPICCLLAMSLPLSTGKASHTSPFLVEYYDRGRHQSKLAIVDSLSIVAGTSNLGFNKDARPLAYEITISFKDLAPFMTMPVRPSFSFSTLEGLFDQENAFNDFMMTMASMRLSDMIYKIPMLKYQVNRVIADIGSYLSPAHLAQHAATFPPLHLISAFMRGVVTN